MISKLENSRKILFEETYGLLKANNAAMYSSDFFILSASNRALSLTDAYCQLVKNENILGAIHLIRLQLDNALRLSALSLVDDVNKFISHFLDGGKISHLKSKDGQKLTDRYLVDQMDKVFSGTKKIYEDACGLIHLSNSHFHSILTSEAPDGKPQVQIGNNDAFSLRQKQSFSLTFLSINNILIMTIRGYKELKEGFKS